MTSTSRYRIHPAIGIGRVGNAPASEYFLGPEVPSQRVQRVDDVGTSVPPFKSNGLIKRQAARFRIWEYVETNGVWTPSREVSLADDDVVELTWTVHLANRKASFLEFHGLAGSPSIRSETTSAATPAVIHASSMSTRSPAQSRAAPLAQSS